ncbi:Cobyrinic acid a,c-diamide synthase [Alkaliphilus metalliredigens QYMF]|uniref:Cobyrinic acid a,c-diamide synthase n=1 Tax=Alkaliphilus metalliredigens (strain QYMF) TaxID=293826 RepID=A6TRN5_ALKMQ|nr:MinD/ParA family protein [Alkaliphilus metalliredigens]ABR48853.1 Cobyrinic acid a,c-diamide synthase [Alkaliphilus metalliredigens QYMF]
MQDQATKLREMIHQRTNSKIIKKNTMSYVTPDLDISSHTNQTIDTKVIGITSGKGGVGKTNFTINLAISLSNENKKVVIIDADLGLANIDIILGVIPKYTLFDVIHQNKNIKEVMTEGPNGIKFISGGSGIIELVDMPHDQLTELIEKFNDIYGYADYILIDTGAGLSNSVLSFVLAVDEAIIITTPEPTALTDAYAMIKAIAKRDKNKKMKIVVNRVESTLEGDITFSKLQKASEKFLNMKVEKAGYLFDDSSVSRAVKLQKPFILQFPNTIASKNIERIAKGLINQRPTPSLEATKEKFMDRLIKLFR